MAIVHYISVKRLSPPALAPAKPAAAPVPFRVDCWRAFRRLGKEVGALVAMVLGVEYKTSTEPAPAEPAAHDAFSRESSPISSTEKADVSSSQEAEAERKTPLVTKEIIEGWHRKCLLEVPDSEGINLGLQGRYDGDYTHHPDGLPAWRRFYEYNSEFLGYRIRDGRVLNSITGEFPLVSEIPQAMVDYIAWFNSQLSSLLEEEILNFAAEAHIRFARIHPFMDGNGRTAEYITNYILGIFGYPEVKNLRI